MARIFPYTRVSTFYQREALDQQDRVVMHYAEFLKIRLNDPDIEVLPIFRDTDSAYKIPFSARPQGSVISGMVRRGDHIVIARVNRIFRNQLDMCGQVKTWLDRGINVHFATEQLDCSTSSGKMLLGILTSIAEGESASLSERMKLSYRERFEVKGYGNNLMSVLMEKASGSKYARLCKNNIAILRYAAYLRRTSYKAHGVAMSWDRVSDRIEAIFAKRENRKVKYLGFRRWRGENLWLAMQRLLRSKHIAIRSAWCCASLLKGPEIMKIGKKGRNAMSAACGTME